MLQNAYLLAKIGADTAENEQNFAEILPKIGNYPTGPPAFTALPLAPHHFPVPPSTHTPPPGMAPPPMLPPLAADQAARAAELAAELAAGG